MKKSVYSGNFLFLNCPVVESVSVLVEKLTLAEPS